MRLLSARLFGEELLDEFLGLLELDACSADDAAAVDDDRAGHELHTKGLRGLAGLLWLPRVALRGSDGLSCAIGMVLLSAATAS